MKFKELYFNVNSIIISFIMYDYKLYTYKSLMVYKSIYVYKHKESNNILVGYIRTSQLMSS